PRMGVCHLLSLRCNHRRGNPGYPCIYEGAKKTTDHFVDLDFHRLRVLDEREHGVFTLSGGYVCPVEQGNEDHADDSCGHDADQDRRSYPLAHLDYRNLNRLLWRKGRYFHDNR